MVKPFFVHCRPQQRLGLHVLLGNVPSGRQVATKASLVKAIVNYLNLALENWSEAVAAALEDTPSGTIFVMRNVTVVLDEVCVDIPPFKSLTVVSQGQRCRIRFYDHALRRCRIRGHPTVQVADGRLTRTALSHPLGWLREFRDKVNETFLDSHAAHVRAVFGLSENAVVRLQNVTVESCTPSRNQRRSILYLGCTWAGHYQSSVEIKEDDLGQGIAGTSFVVMFGALEKHSCKCGECEPHWFTAGWICPVVFHRWVQVRRANDGGDGAF